MLNGAMPAFGLDSAALAIAFARWIAVGGMLSLFGALLFRAAIMRTAGRGIVWGSLIAALLGLGLWLGFEASDLGGPPDLVLHATLFGRVLTFQVLALVLAGLLAVPKSRLAASLAAVCAGLAVALEVGHL
ncbi:MAG: hypothetical protein J2P47_12780, partial [Acetobacteraceae bacterium]|nr:hypothetical protein [Acetobacteraceae bacterium]